MEAFYFSMNGVRQGQFKGTKKFKGSSDWMVGVRFSMQAIAPHDTATRQATGRRRYLPITILKHWDAASLQVLKAMTSGETLNSVILEFIRKTADGEETSWQRITLTNCVVLDVRRFADFTAPQAASIVHEFEEISLAWQKITVEDLAGNSHFTDNWA